MTYPPQEGFPPPEPQFPATQPVVQFPAQPQTAPGYQPAPSPQSSTPYGSSEAQGRSTALVLLAGAAALLLVFGGLMFGLYLNAHGTLNDTKANLRDTRADLTSQVKEQQSIVTERQEKLTEAEKRASDLNTQLDATKTKLADVTAQNAVLVPCMRRIQDAFDAAANGDSSGGIRALRLARTSCDRAEIKVDS